MSNTPKSESALLAAALAFDAELTRYARAADAACRRSLDTQKNMALVADALREAADTEEKLGPAAQVLLQALVTARDAQQKQSEQVHARALELEKRTQAHIALMERLKALGDEAGNLTESAKKLMGEKRTGSLLAERKEVQEGLVELDARVSDAAKGAETLTVDAREAAFDEISRQAHSFQQMFVGIRNKVNILRKALDTDAPAA